ncbi:cytochrome b5 [Trichoderma novae-zelandiae]
MEYVEHRMNDEAIKQATNSAGLVSPLNLALLAILLYTAYATFLSKPSYPTLPRPAPPAVFKTYTPRTLLPFNGAGGAPVFLAVRGAVFDVSRGRNFYGPGGPYENFAGRDASRGLACGSFDEEMLTEDLDGPLDTLADLGGEEMEALRGWEERFGEKYDVVGRLVSVKEFEELDKKE